jgi:hypothetical protein
MARRSLLARMTGLPVRLGERLGLFDHVPPGLPEGAPPPRHTFRWDLDKTYLRTEFDSLGDLVKSAIETASDKQAYPGATALLRALRQEGNRICIVSGSPTQMRQVLAAKLALDGVEYDEFVLENNLKNLLRGRFRALRAQIPYKLPAMLRSRIGAAADAETIHGLRPECCRASGSAWPALRPDGSRSRSCENPRSRRRITPARPTSPTSGCPPCGAVCAGGHKPRSSSAGRAKSRRPPPSATDSAMTLAAASPLGRCPRRRRAGRSSGTPCRECAAYRSSPAWRTQRRLLPGLDESIRVARPFRISLRCRTGLGALVTG